jgi:hypothetical protein
MRPSATPTTKPSAAVEGRILETAPNILRTMQVVCGIDYSKEIEAAEKDIARFSASKAGAISSARRISSLATSHC